MISQFTVMFPASCARCLASWGLRSRQGNSGPLAVQADNGAHGVRVDSCAQRCWAAGQGGSVGAIDGGLAGHRVPSRVLRGKLPYESVTRLRAGLRRGCHCCPRSAWRGLLSTAKPVRGWLVNYVLRPAALDRWLWVYPPSGIRDHVSPA